MKRCLIFFISFAYAMEEAPAILETHHSTYDVRIIPIITITRDEEAEFQQTVIAALDREVDHRLRDIENQTSPDNRNIMRTIKDNKKLILSNLITALLSSVVTLIVHFTATS